MMIVMIDGVCLMVMVYSGCGVIMVIFDGDDGNNADDDYDGSDDERCDSDDDGGYGMVIAVW